MINALQFTDLAVGGFEAAVEGFVHRRQEQAAHEAQEDAHAAWASADAWQDHAKGLEHRNAQLASSLAQLQNDHSKALSRQQNIQAAFERHITALVLRIRELDEKLQQVSARRFALTCARARERQSRLPEASTPECLEADDRAYQANVAWFLANRNVRLGVPDAFERMKR
jgi:hypothetical protein